MIIAWIQRYAMVLMGVAMAATLVALIERQFELMAERTARATEQANYNRERADAAEQARTWQAGMFRSYETATRTADERRAALQTRDRTIAALQARIATLSVDVGGLRTQLAAYARGDPGDTLAACQARAVALADELGQGAGLVARTGELAKRIAGVARESAVAEAEHAVKVNQCVEAWPR